MTNKEAVSVADELEREVTQHLGLDVCVPEQLLRRARLMEGAARKAIAALRSAAPNADDKPVAWVTPRTMKALRRRDRQGVSTATMGRRTEKKTEPLYAARPSPPDDAVLRIPPELRTAVRYYVARAADPSTPPLCRDEVTEAKQVLAKLDAALASSTKKETPRG